MISDQSAVARMERSGNPGTPVPHFAALHAGYALTPVKKASEVPQGRIGPYAERASAPSIISTVLARP
jgi:hypothetical protein